MGLIETYFPEITSLQQQQFAALGPLYQDWNQKINIISRKDISNLYLHHVLHSLALAKYDPFQKGMTVLDAGTGGGFPGIPLAIMYPDVRFILVDSTAKKIHVVHQVAQALMLENVTGIHSRLEDHQGAYDLIISRAVSTLPQLIEWTQHLSIENRWIALKGGDRKNIRKELPPYFRMAFIAVGSYFQEPYFDEKWIVDVRK